MDYTFYEEMLGIINLYIHTKRMRYNQTPQNIYKSQYTFRALFYTLRNLINTDGFQTPLHNFPLAFFRVYFKTLMTSGLPDSQKN